MLRPQLALLILLAATALAADPVAVRRVPPPGITITSADRAELTAGVEALGREITALEKDLSRKPELLALLPDVQIFHKAVDWALRYDEFFAASQVAIARQQLALGKARAADLRAGRPSWNFISGADTKPAADGKDKLPVLVVRGYKSKIDGSIQPYGIVLPEDYKPAGRPPSPTEGRRRIRVIDRSGAVKPVGDESTPSEGRPRVRVPETSSAEKPAASEPAPAEGRRRIRVLDDPGAIKPAAPEPAPTEERPRVRVIEPVAATAAPPAQLRPLHFWCHGRGEKLSELDFINGRLTSKGEYTPPGAFVIHLYGRYCCANKFAGEVDLFEALADAKKHYPIDDARLVIRGFSMGGASTWQFATHFAGMWAAANPGAGFGESKEFLKLGLTPDKPLPPEWEQKLWRWYDSTLYVSNLANTTTVAYSGEIDGQKQAADIMIRYARQEAGNTSPPVAELGKVAPGDGSPKADEARVAGTAPDLALYHVIAPNTPHKVAAEAKPEVEKLIEAAVEKGREAAPKKVLFTTYSLVYPVMEWVMIRGMEKQWERADLTAEVVGDGIVVTTKNINALQLFNPLGKGVSPVDRIHYATLDGAKIPVEWIGDEKDAAFHKQQDGKWVGGPKIDPPGENPMRKQPGLCGPIDHAFMNSFVFVRPTGKPLNKVVGDWVESELGHATTQWRAVFRGDARVVADTAVSADDIANSNLILWGDPSSNAVLKKLLAAKLEGAAPSAPSTSRPGGDGAPPSSALRSILQWDGKTLVFAGKTYDAAHTAPILVFPNPLNPARYVVLNSGFTFREAAALNNAQQTPKLPDWAIVDLRTPPDANWPGKILRAGFFDEQWQPPAP